MSARRVQFCGVIEGSVKALPGETDAQAIARAEQRLNLIMDKRARALGNYPEHGPNIGLEDANIGSEL